MLGLRSGGDEVVDSIGVPRSVDDEIKEGRRRETVEVIQDLWEIHYLKNKDVDISERETSSFVKIFYRLWTIPIPVQDLISIV